MQSWEESPLASVGEPEGLEGESFMEEMQAIGDKDLPQCLLIILTALRSLFF